MHPTAPAHLPRNLYLETAAGSKGLSEQQKLNSEINSRLFLPISAVFGRYLANVLLTRLLDSATPQLLEEIHAPKSNTGLTLEAQGRPGMIQRCSSWSHFVPVATLPSTNMEHTNWSPCPAPLPAPCTSEGLCAPWTPGQLFLLGFGFFPLIVPRGFPFTLLYLLYLKCWWKIQGDWIRNGTLAFNSFPDAGSGCTILYKSFCHLGFGNTKPIASPAQSQTISHTFCLYNEGCTSLLPSLSLESTK